MKIDPPYNTGNKDFIYNDSFVDKTDGYSHSKWLSFMSERLEIARELLSDEGVIFISIDDNEQAQLKLLCDEVFGEENFIGEYIKQSKVGGGNDSKFIVKEHEYCKCYAKNILNTKSMYINHSEEYLKRYKEEDEYGRFFWDTFARPGLKNPIIYDIVAPDGRIINNGWIRSKERFEKEYEEGKIRIIKKKNGEWSVQFKQYLNLQGKTPRSMTMDFGGTTEGDSELKRIFGKKVFNYPKSIKYLVTLISTIANKNALILDFFAGSGAFLVRAMTDAMDDCEAEEERNFVKKNQIFGIEYEDGAFGLSSTNMLIHGDGNSNVVQASMFERGEWIKDSDINIVLMNPPYNATKKFCDPEHTKTWYSKKKEDPSKGFHFVEWVARHVHSSYKIAVLLPMQDAIGNSGDVKKHKKTMLDNYTLDAVFSLPNEMFYPGASAIACCMIFYLSQKHERSNRDTFFGYFKDDKFIKRKGLGRVEQTDPAGNSLWDIVENEWLNLYKNKREVPGLSVMKKVSYDDEWLAEAYMETDYSKLTIDDFERTVRDYYAYLIRSGDK